MILGVKYFKTRSASPRKGQRKSIRVCNQCIWTIFINLHLCKNKLVLLVDSWIGVWNSPKLNILSKTRDVFQHKSIFVLSISILTWSHQMAYFSHSLFILAKYFTTTIISKQIIAGSEFGILARQKFYQNLHPSKI